MSYVKGVPEDERHVLMYLGSIMDQARDAYRPDDWPGLRPSHFRVLGSVPDEGISVTDLAQRVRMTKQGCGQFVTQLVDSGHLVTETDPDDRRVRVVRRTTLGKRSAREAARAIARIEDDWRSTVGDRRYRTFRTVLEDLASREH